MMCYNYQLRACGIHSLLTLKKLLRSNVYDVRGYSLYGKHLTSSATVPVLTVFSVTICWSRTAVCCLVLYIFDNEIVSFSLPSFNYKQRNMDAVK